MINQPENANRQMLQPGILRGHKFRGMEICDAKPPVPARFQTFIDNFDILTFCANSCESIKKAKRPSFLQQCFLNWRFLLFSWIVALFWCLVFQQFA